MERLLELARERKLDRVGAAYAVTGWVIVQAASIIFPTFDAPASALRWLIVVVIAGFPVALTYTWFAQSDSGTALRPLAVRDWLLFGMAGLIALLLAGQLTLSWVNRRETIAKAPGTAQTTSSVAVLPFANLSGDPNKVYFSDGIADQLISELARTPSLRVAARSSSFAFHGKDVDVKTVAKTLNVRTILEGSVREDGNRVRISAELVDATNGFQIWSDTYDRDLTNILGLQDDIAHAINGALTKRFWGKTLAANRGPKPRPINPEAYKTYLQGQYYFAQRSREGIARAVDLFKRVTSLAPDYTDGFAALADAYATAVLDFQVPGSLPLATDAIARALALDPNNPTALMARAIVELLQWRWRESAVDLKRLERLQVNAASVWHMRAIFFDYMALAQFAGPAEEKATKLDPLSYVDRYNLAVYRMLQKRYDEAERIAGEAWALQPAHPDLQQLMVQIALGKHDMKPAERTLASLSAQTGEASPNTLAARFYIDVAKKDFAAAHRIVDAGAKAFPASGIAPTDLGSAYAITNDLDSAIKWYRRAVDLHDPQFLRVPYANPELTKLYADPRWKKLRAEPEVRDWEEARREIAAEFQAGE
jgi:TolB-like protein